jgi:hypothetical protein
MTSLPSPLVSISQLLWYSRILEDAELLAHVDMFFGSQEHFKYDRHLMFQL